MEGSLNMINREQLTKEILESWDELFKLEKGIFKSIPHMKDLTQKVKKQYENFKPYLPIINDLRNPCLEKRHW
jgi:dynein heavy chain